MSSTLRRTLVRRWTIIPLVLAAAVGGGTWFLTRSSASGEEQPDAAVEQTVEVTSETLSRTVTASGTIEAAETEQLSFSAAGTVAAVNVEAGDEVSAGDVLATIDSAALEADVSEAEATVAEAEAQLDSDQDTDASDAQIAADESSLSAAQADLDAAREALAGADLVAGVEGTVSTVNLTVGEELGDGGASGSDVTGSGTGSGRSSGTLGSDDQAGGAQPGMSSGSGSSTDGSSSSDTSSEAQIEVVSTGSYVVNLGLDDTEIEQVEAGQTATVRPSDSASTAGPGGFPQLGGGSASGGQDADSDDESSDSETGDTEQDGGQEAVEATGLVTSVGEIADASSGVASYPVDVAFGASPDEFHVGATAEVEIVYDEIADAIQVPSQAVTTENGASTVVVAAGDGREERTVETGITSGGMVQITSGLEAGEQVVVTFGGAPGGGRDSGGENPGGGQGPGGGGFTPPEGFEPPAGGGFPGGAGGGEGG